MTSNSDFSLSSASESVAAEPPGGWPKPSVTVDLVLFAWNEAIGWFETLLIKRGRPPFAGLWAIPGGFLDLTEEPEAAALRELAEETGITLTRPPELLGVYAKVNRDPRGRTISLAYVELIDSKLEPRAGDDARQARWWGLNELPRPLAFDHDAILTDARSWLINRLTDRSSRRAEAEGWPPRRFALKEVTRWFRAAGIARPGAAARRWLQAGIRSGALVADPERTIITRRGMTADVNRDQYQ